MYDNLGFGTVSQEPIDQTPLSPQPESSVEPVELPEVDETQQVAEAAPMAQPEPAPAPVRKKPSQEQQDRNFYELRKREELRERELELMRREIEQLRAQNTNKAPIRSTYEELGIEKDSIAEVQHVEKIVQRALAQQEERYRQQLEEQKRLNAERLIQKEYKDLYQVLTPENLRRLEQEEPEIAASIASNPDTYSAKIAAYKQIKRLGIEEQSYNEYRVQERLAQNATRPKSPAAIAPRQGSTALQAAHTPSNRYESITEEMAARYRKEMEDAIRGA